MWLNLLAIFTAFLEALFSHKKVGDEAIEKVITERDEALKSVGEANDTRARIERDPDYANVIRLHFERKDSD